MFAINPSGYVVYGLGYLLLYPKYSCQQLINGIWVPISSDSDNCKPDYFCHNKETLKFQRIDDDVVSLNNWME